MWRRAAWALALWGFIWLPAGAQGADPEERINITEKDFQALDQPSARPSPGRSRYVINNATPEIRQALIEQQQEVRVAREEYDREIGVSKTDPEWLKQLKRRTARKLDVVTARYEQLLSRMEANYQAMQTMVYRQQQVLLTLENQYRDLLNRTHGLVPGPPVAQLESVTITPYTGNVILRRRR